jgi:hypothetical protein
MGSIPITRISKGPVDPMKWLLAARSAAWTMSGTAAGWWVAVRGGLGGLDVAPALDGLDVLGSTSSSSSPFGATTGAPSAPWSFGPSSALAYGVFGAFSGFWLVLASRAGGVGGLGWPLANHRRTGPLRDPVGGQGMEIEFDRLAVDVRDLQNLLDERTNVLINRIGELRSDVSNGFASMEMQGTVIAQGLEMQGTVIAQGFEKLEMQGAVINGKLEMLESVSQPVFGGQAVASTFGLAKGASSSQLWPKIVDVGIKLALAPYGGPSP